MARTSTFAGLMLVLTSLAGCAFVRSDLSAPAEMELLGGEPVVVMRDGRVLPVVTDNAPANRWAAMFLAETIEKTCGKRPRVHVVFPGQTCSISNGLFVGGSRSEETSSPGAFRVEAKDGRIRFAGRADYAVFDWCERYLGMRYYCAEGKCHERRTEIVVPAVVYSDAPVYDHRILSGNTTWARVAKTGSEHRGGVSVHAPHGWYRDPELQATHPDIFETGRTPMLCYGNPATLACYEDRIDRQISGRGDAGGIVDTKRKVVTVSQWDAPVRCVCDWCRPLADPSTGRNRSASPILWERFLPRLANWLKAHHPDYMISFLPYLNTVEPPQRDVGLAALGNCEAEVCTMPGLALLKDDATRKREEAILRGWKKATGRKVLNWNYGCWPRDYTSAPYVFGRTIQRHLSAMTGTVAGTFICGGEGDPSLALSLYVWMKCLWNPEIDVEAVYDGFASRMFGPAMRPMRELIALQERCWERPWNSTECTYGNVFEISYPPEDVAKMKALLAEAWQLALSDGISRKRVAWYANGFSRFFRDQEMAVRARRETDAAIRPGDVREMVLATGFARKPWAGTTVEIRPNRAKSGMDLIVRCEEPAASNMDFTQIDGDFVHGDDSVSFSFDGFGSERVFKDGSRTGGILIAPSVSHDRTSWTVTASLDLPVQHGCLIRGNICRWRVGDRRQPESRRVPGSRYEHSRLKTVQTHPDTDPAAFVTFDLSQEKNP